MPPRIRLGVNTCFAVKRWASPQDWAAVIVDELGLDCCQVSLDLVDPGLDQKATFGYAEQAREAADRRDLELHSTFTGLAAYAGSQLLHPQARMREAAIVWFQAAIEVTAMMGVLGTGGFLGAFSAADAATPSRREPLLREYGTALHRLAEHARSHGLEFLLFENMAVEREFGHSIEEAHAVEEMATAAAVPWRLCLDIGHPCALHTGTLSDDPMAWLAQPWRQLPILQVQQANRDGDFHWPFTIERNAVGSVDGPAVAAALRRWPVDEDVYLFLEVIHAPETDSGRVVAELRESVAYWRDALGGPEDGATP